MSDSAKQVLVSVGLAAVVLFLFSFLNKEKDNTNKNGKKKYNIPEADPTALEGNPQALDAYDALCAYIEAYNDGQDAKFLQAMNDEFKKEMGLCVYENADGSISVEDLKGNEILFSQQMS